MARTAAAFTGGMRPSHHLGVSVIARVYPREAVRAALRSLGRDSHRRRDLPAEVMVYHVIAMALLRTVSAREVLRCLVDGLRWISPDLPVRVSGKSSISRARTRLGATPFSALRDSCVAPLAHSGTPGAWYRGLRLVAFDGSSLNPPDEARNREAFGLPGSSHGISAFPQARVTAMVELGTHAAFAWHAGPLAEGEAEQAERLFGHLSPGMLVLADRCHAGSPLWSRATATGADLLWRFKGNMKFPVAEALDDGSWRSVIRGSGRDRRRSRGELPVRIVACRIEGGAELAALYHERWEIETDRDEVRTRILGPGAALRSKTPDLVFQEVDGLMLARYAVRCLIHEAAEKAGEDPDRLPPSASVARRRAGSTAGRPRSSRIVF